MYIRFDTPCISEKNYISADNTVVFSLNSNIINHGKLARQIS